MSENNGNGNVTQTMQQEWQRVTANPDNFIVSDVLRSALPDQIVAEESISSILEIEIKLGDLEIEAPMTRLDMSSTGWVCQVSADSSDAAVLLSYTLQEISEAEFLIKDKGNTLVTLKSRPSDELSYSIDSDGRYYYMTFTCQLNEEIKDES